MSSRRILYDEMRARGISRCGYARELYEIVHGKGTRRYREKPIEKPLGRLKQYCSLLEGSCIHSKGFILPTNTESHLCPIYRHFQQHCVALYQRSLKLKKDPHKEIRQLPLRPDYTEVLRDLEERTEIMARSELGYTVIPREIAESIIEEIEIAKKEARNKWKLVYSQQGHHHSRN